MTISETTILKAEWRGPGLLSLRFLLSHVEP